MVDRADHRSVIPVGRIHCRGTKLFIGAVHLHNVLAATGRSRPIIGDSLGQLNH
jgi:hypothetical protein